MIKFESENSGKWWEFLVGWKWPHQGFTVGYDIVEPSEQPDNGFVYFSLLIYLGPISLILNWGDENWEY